MSDYPQLIKDKLEILKKHGGTYIMEDNNNTYILIALGERPSGGYKIEVLDAIQVETTDGPKLSIFLKEKRPHQKDVVIQMLTYPTKILQIPKTNLPITIHWTKSLDKLH